MDTIDTYVAKQRHFYENQVKPHIEDKNYFAAHVIFSNVMDNLVHRRLEVETGINCGLTYFACAAALHHELAQGKLDPNTLRAFETMSAKTKLPDNRNN